MLRGRTQIVGDDDGCWSKAIPEWVKNNIMDDFDNEGFKFY